MRLLRAILLGIFLWILIFVEWTFMMFIPVLQGKFLLQWIIHFILLLGFVVFVARIYYMKRDRLNGLLLGVIFVIVGTILDLIITAPFFTGYGAYYSNILLWLGFLEVLLVSWVVGIFSR